MAHLSPFLWRPLTCLACALVAAGVLLTKSAADTALWSSASQSSTSTQSMAATSARHFAWVAHDRHLTRMAATVSDEPKDNLLDVNHLADSEVLHAPSSQSSWSLPNVMAMVSVYFAALLSVWKWQRQPQQSASRKAMAHHHSSRLVTALYATPSPPRQSLIPKASQRSSMQLQAMALSNLFQTSGLGGNLTFDAFPISGGSYGCVYGGEWQPDGSAEKIRIVAKRAWTAAELQGRDQSLPQDSTYRASRCALYWSVEHHCIEKLAKAAAKRIAADQGTDPSELYLAPYLGTAEPASEQPWLVWKDVGGSSDLRGQTVHDVLKEAHDLQVKNPSKDPAQDDALSLLMQCLKWGDDRDEAAHLLLEQLLQGVVCCHKSAIVHRDIKPGNLLLDANSGTLRLIDFGSAADMEPSNGISAFLGTFGIGDGGRVGFDHESAAVSPIYSAPEVFLNPDRRPYQFDVFSVAMVYMQLIFPNLADERGMATFRQQLEDVKFDLEQWLEGQLEATVLPKGVTVGLRYLAAHQSIWKLLGKMLHPDPMRRISATDALQAVKLAPIMVEVPGPDKDSFLQVVIESSQCCPMPTATTTTTTQTGGTVMLLRPLSIVATFQRNQPLGLALATKFDDLGSQRDLAPELQALWDEGTKDATPADVFIREIVPGGQAEKIGLLQVGDRLQMVGDIEVSSNGGGYDRAVRLIKRQPKRNLDVRLLFSRRRLTPASQSLTNVGVIMDDTTAEGPSHETSWAVADCGAWSVKGLRSTQEDTFLLTHLKSKSKELYIAGVFDGHAGYQASQHLVTCIPEVFSRALRTAASGASAVTLPVLREALVRTWKEACDMYHDMCPEGACLAKWDTRGGRVEASISSDDLSAGSTAAMAIVSEQLGTALVLNCGDSKVVIGSRQEEGWVVDFATRDHSPSDEAEQRRLRAGRATGLGYGEIECELGAWRLRVFEYSYLVSRSLEGPLATSKGIISTPDIDVLAGLSDGTERILCVASDGLWGVADPGQVMHYLGDMRAAGWTSEAAARKLCEEALEAESKDNVTCVVLYL